ncbi:MAG: NfeD family protein [Syntrophales bacterium]
MKQLHRFRLLSRQAKKDVLVRYVLFQVPDVLILTLVFWALRQWTSVPTWLMWGVILCWVLKDILLFPFIWSAFEAVSADARQALVGAEGVSVEELDPSGYIRVHGVLWRAQVIEPGTVVRKGDPVVVQGVEGFLIKVRPKPAEP